MWMVWKSLPILNTCRTVVKSITYYGFTTSEETIKRACISSPFFMIFPKASLYWYLQEIVVLPEYQGKGIGARIVKKLIRYVKENGIPGIKMTIRLMAAKGKELFYEKLGVMSVPDDGDSSGMRMCIQL